MTAPLYPHFHIYEIASSEKKAEVNRRNALKSTGPRTPEGKAAVRLNALKHGLLSQEILLPGEDEEALRELGQSLRDELQPVGELENLLVERIIASYWRLRRLGRVEVGIFAWERSEELAERAEREAHRYYSDHVESLMKVRRNFMADNRSNKEALLSRARRLRNEQEKDEIAKLGQSFTRDANRANAFSKLSRYETAIERALYRALHELERRQASRRGAAVKPPNVVDVEVSGMPEVTGH